MAAPKTLVIFDDRTRSFRCAGCLGHPVPVPAATMKNPEGFVQMRERIEEDHAECPTYDSPRLALNARLMKIRIRRANSKKTRTHHFGGNVRWGSITATW
jgi:hypothetical protein